MKLSKSHYKPTSFIHTKIIYIHSIKHLQLQIQSLLLMLSSVPRHQKLFQIDIASDSEDLDQEPQTQRSHYNDFTRQNPQKQNKSPETSSIQVSQLEQSTITHPASQESKRPRCQPLRRNHSFKPKKTPQEENQKLKPAINKSVSKVINISEEADEVEARSSGRFAVYEQNPKDQKMNLDATVSSSFSNSITLDIIKKAQESPVLRISNFVKAESKKYESVKKSVSFMDQSMVSEKLQRKSGHCQKNALNSLLEKKLCQKPKPKPSVVNQAKKQPKTALKIDQTTDMPTLIQKKISSSHFLLARIKKVSTMLNWLWPQYHMRDQKSGIHILSAKKKAANTTSNYYLSMSQKQIDVQNQNYTGKVRGNFVGSCFNIFSKGVSPESNEPGSKDKESVRKLLASVVYESQFGNSNPKSFKVYMLKPGCSYYELEGTSIKSEEKGLEKLYELGQNKSKMWQLVNRKPTYNKKLNRFVLGFEGRVKLPSTKNFILQDMQTKRQVLMFGKVQTEQYVMQVSSPLTPQIALGIVMAEMDNKIICD